MAEGENIVAPIIALIDAFSGSGSTVAATCDYHPIDHVSFTTHGGPFPCHRARHRRCQVPPTDRCRACAGMRRFGWIKCSSCSNDARAHRLLWRPSLRQILLGRHRSYLPCCLPRSKRGSARRVCAVADGLRSSTLDRFSRHEAECLAALAARHVGHGSHRRGRASRCSCCSGGWSRPRTGQLADGTQGQATPLRVWTRTRLLRP